MDEYREEKSQAADHGLASSLERVSRSGLVVCGCRSILPQLGNDGKGDAHLADLASQALARADASWVMVLACRAASDDRGAVVWRRRQLAHQAIAWSAGARPTRVQEPDL